MTTEMMTKAQAEDAAAQIAAIHPDPKAVSVSPMGVDPRSGISDNYGVCVHYRYQILWAEKAEELAEVLDTIINGQNGLPAYTQWHRPVATYQGENHGDVTGDYAPHA